MKKKSASAIASSIVSAVFLFFLLPVAGLADGSIARFAFSTDPQTVRPGEISDSLTIQAQNDAGNPSDTDETMDLAFSSTSASGEFLSAAGDAVRTVMNKGTANRTFYYKDTSPGTYTMTVKVTGRTSGKSWSANQQIVVGYAVPATAQSAPSASSSAAAPYAASAGASAHAAVGGLPAVATIQAFAGDDRTIPVGTEASFAGEAIGLVGAPITGARFWWNFGDGETHEGKTVGHVYRELGLYTVALFVSSGDYAASDYALAKVVPNKIAIASVTKGADGGIHIFNPDSMAVDIGGWILEDDAGKRFFLPVHTVVAPSAEAVFAARVSGLAPDKKVYLRHPDESLAISWSAAISEDDKKSQDASAHSFVTSAVLSEAVSTHASSEPGSKIADKMSVPLSGRTSLSTSSLAAVGASAPTGRQEAQNPDTRKIMSSLHFPNIFFGAAFVLSIAASAGFFLVRRVLP